MIEYDQDVFMVPLKEKNLERYRLARNDVDVRSWCRQVGEISEMQQAEWYKRQDQDPSIMMFELHNFSNGLIGVCGLTDIDHMNQRAEFSLYIFPKYRKRGLAQKGLKTLIKFGFNELNLNLIWGESFESNPARKMFKSLGFKETGFRPDYYFKNGIFLDAYLYCLRRDECKF